jgi:preprotein translocase subunit SecE
VAYTHKHVLVLGLANVGFAPYLVPDRNQVRNMASTFNPLQFIQQVRAEVSKIVWPSRREVALTTAMVFVMATLTAIFFFFVDLIIRTGLQGLFSYFN